MGCAAVTSLAVSRTEARMTGSATARIKVPETARQKQIGHGCSAGTAGFSAGERPSFGPILGFAELRPAVCPQSRPTLWTCPIESPSCSARASSASHAPKRRGIAVMLSTIPLGVEGRFRDDALSFEFIIAARNRLRHRKSQGRYDAGPTQARRGGRKILTFQGALVHGRPTFHNRRTVPSGRPLSR